MNKTEITKLNQTIKLCSLPRQLRLKYNPETQPWLLFMASTRSINLKKSNNWESQFLDTAESTEGFKLIMFSV